MHHTSHDSACPPYLTAARATDIGFASATLIDESPCLQYDDALPRRCISHPVPVCVLGSPKFNLQMPCSLFPSCFPRVEVPRRGRCCGEVHCIRSARPEQPWSLACSTQAVLPLPPQGQPGAHALSLEALCPSFPSRQGPGQDSVRQQQRASTAAAQVPPYLGTLAGDGRLGGIPCSGESKIGPPVQSLCWSPSHLLRLPCGSMYCSTPSFPLVHAASANIFSPPPLPSFPGPSSSAIHSIPSAPLSRNSVLPTRHLLFSTAEKKGRKTRSGYHLHPHLTQPCRAPSTTPAPGPPGPSSCCSSTSTPQDRTPDSHRINQGVKKPCRKRIGFESHSLSIFLGNSQDIKKRDRTPLLLYPSRDPIRDSQPSPFQFCKTQTLGDLETPPPSATGILRLDGEESPNLHAPFRSLRAARRHRSAFIPTPTSSLTTGHSIQFVCEVERSEESGCSSARPSRHVRDLLGRRIKSRKGSHLGRTEDTGTCVCVLVALRNLDRGEASELVSSTEEEVCLVTTSPVGFL